ncbi:MAG: hypothetical protein JNL40_04980 [Cyclobacteriaceae bacterium]|nr:hypothetical protein [Cyclobacteriaceae bacterium]
MKTSLLLLLLGLVVASAEAQVSFRSDIVLGKHVRNRSKGLSFITLSVGRTRTPWGTFDRNTVIIDVAALRNPGKSYTYRQVAERVYGLAPGIPPGHMFQPMVPEFLLAEPPPVIRPVVPVVKVRR